MFKFWERINENGDDIDVREKFFANFEDICSDKSFD